ncbi:S-adenosyl-L-methionine-dependent methyltransferase [Blastocladiella britannica]|nr:S-adenosyl-L-methionine-dependent methyltransferase [Blastocladiella britannica]
MTAQRLVAALASALGSHEAATFELRFLAAHAAALPESSAPSASNVYHFVDQLPAPAQARLDTMVAQRAKKHMPLQYILGTVPFANRLELFVEPPVLIPRWETDEWVERLARRTKEHWAPCAGPLRIADLCSGSGCVGLGLASHLAETAASGVAITGYDVVPAAIALAARNAAHNPFPGVSARYLLTDLMSPSTTKIEPADLVVANPPYISERDYAGLDPSVREWEDRTALVGGEHGTKMYAKLVDLAASALTPRKSLDPAAVRLAMEIGDGQGAEVAAIVKRRFQWADVWRDLAGQERCVVAGGPTNHK